MIYISLHESNGDYFSSESEVKESDLREVYDGMVFVAKKYRQLNLGAALVNSLSASDKMTYFNDVIIKLFQKHRLPRPGKPPYLKFQEDMRDTWNSLKVKTGTDYDNPKTIRALLKF